MFWKPNFEVELNLILCSNQRLLSSGYLTLVAMWLLRRLSFLPHNTDWVCVAFLDKVPFHFTTSELNGLINALLQTFAKCWYMSNGEIDYDEPILLMNRIKVEEKKKLVYEQSPSKNPNQGAFHIIKIFVHLILLKSPFWTSENLRVRRRNRAFWGTLIQKWCPFQSTFTKSRRRGFFGGILRVLTSSSQHRSSCILS